MLRSLLSVLIVIQILTVVAFGESAAKGLDVAYYNKVRFDYAARKDFAPAWNFEEDRKAVIEALQKEDFDKCKELGDAWLRKVPVDAEIYLVIALARKAKGDLAGYTSYMGEFYGFLRSITSTGDGLSAKTAFRVIAVSEEYALLRDIGAKVKQQSLVDDCDVIVVDQRGKEMTYYFNVKISLDAQKRELGIK